MRTDHGHDGGSAKPGPPNRISPTRAVGLVTLVLAVLLGSAYALGRSLAPDRPRSTVPLAQEPQYADQVPAGRTAGASPDRPGGPNEAGQHADGARTAAPAPSESTGAFETRTTTGTAAVALTFDDGPNPQYTPQVLAVLREHRVRATFCLVGENAQNHPDLIRAIVADGHTLCNHSWNHDVSLGARSPERIRADLVRTSEAIRAAVPNAPIAYYRQPGGAWTYSVVSVARKLGMTPLHWAVDPSDWQAPGANVIASTVITKVQPGSVVLLHDAGGYRQGTVDALHRILPNLTSRFRVEPLPADPT